MAYVNSKELDVGTSVGLDPETDLAQKCADFYLLEMMQEELTEVVRWDKDNKPLRLPLEFGSDSAVEKRAYKVLVSLEDLERGIADSFVRYLTIACGGELRHAVHFGGGKDGHYGTAHTVNDCKHHHVEHKCCFHDCELWACHFNFLDCGCSCNHKHQGAPACVAGLSGCQVSFCCGHECKEGTICFTVKGGMKLPDRVHKYLQEVKPYYQTRSTSRGMSWEAWWKHHQDDPAGWMRECGISFDTPLWGGGSIGGHKWATAAHLTADYLEGKITRRTFIDRCWSLQHNNGCMFNKFYETDSLMRVLAKQAVFDYDYLSNKASWYVDDLWREYQIKTGKKTILDYLRKKKELELSSDESSWEENEGCYWCWAHFQSSGNIAPCGYGDDGYKSSSCAYSEEEKEEDLVCIVCGGNYNNCFC